MAAGKINLDVRYRDVDSGRGVALDFLSGTVKNAVGDTVETLTPEAMIDAEGAYYVIPDYDVTRPEFVGLFLTVDWVAVRYGTLLPTVVKRYDYRPVSRTAGVANIVTWEPVCTNAIFYEVVRERGGVEEFVGRSFTSVYVDRSAFPNEMEAKSYKYFAYPAYRKPGELQADGSDYEVSGTRINCVCQRVSRPVCLITGRIVDVFGLSAAHVYTSDDPTFEHEIVFSVNPRDYHIIDKDLYVVPEDVYAKLNDLGEFSAALMQDLVVELRVPHDRFRGRFVVPRKDEAVLEDLDMEILRDY